MSPDERDLLLTLGAVDALTPAETAELDEMLTSNPAAAAEFAELRDVATILAEAVAEDPPERLRAAVLAAVAGTAPGSFVGDGDVGEALTGGPLPVDDTPLAPVVPLRRRRWMVPATAAAAVVALLVAGLIINRDADAPGDDDMMAAVLDDDDAVSVELTGTVGELRVVKSADAGATVLLADDIPVPEGDRVMQLWAIRDDQPEPMTTFRPDGEGSVEVVVDGVFPEDTQYAVTVEPEGGSDVPTMPIVAASPPVA